MKTKIAYVLTSSEQDVYLEQAYVSMYSLKRYNSDAHVVLFVDKQTEETFTGVRKDMLKYVDELVVRTFESGLSAQVRSRLLKSSLRNYVKGDYLFIDTDTIIVKSLAEIDNCPYDIAACQDTHTTFKENPFHSMCVEHGKILGWPVEHEDTYFNSGVVYVKDNETTHKFYRIWNEEWIKGEKKSVRMDQPAFAKANYMMGHIIQELDDFWNCELRYGIRYLKDARIVHYLGGLQYPNHLFYLYDKNAFNSIKNDAIIPDRIKECVEDVFKGFERVTISASGMDVNLQLDVLYNILSRDYGKGIYKFYRFIIRGFDFILKIPYKIKSNLIV